MKTLVTGGTGFTGSHLVERLLQLGHEVRVLDNQPGLARDRLEARGATITLGSVTDPDAVDLAVAGCDRVFHVAAAFRNLKASKQTYWDVNVEGTRHVCAAAMRHGVQRLVYCSTQGVHGHVQHPPANEDSPIAPADHYQYTKYKGEKVVNQFIVEGLNATTLRPTAIYGPGDPGRWVMLFKHTANGRFLMLGDGETTYHPLYIDNLVDAFLLAAERPDAEGQTYLIGDAKYHTLNDLVHAVGEVAGRDVKITHVPFCPVWLLAAACEWVCKPLGISPPLFRRRVDWFRQVRGFDLAKARTELGYEPSIDLHEGLTRTYRWYLEHGYLGPSEARAAHSSPT